MANASIYLNFRRETEEAFRFYQSVFGGEFTGGGIMRFRDIPPADANPPLPEEERDLVMHVGLPLPGGLELMGSDTPESLGFRIVKGNNVYISLDPETRVETRRIFDELARGGQVMMELQDMFWGGYYGTCIDRFGIHWMFNCTAAS